MFLAKSQDAGLVAKEPDCRGDLWWAGGGLFESNDSKYYMIYDMDPTEQLEIETRIAGVLKSIYDPEIPVNIYDLGLIYNIEIDDDHIAHITMTLTAPNCPMAEDLIEEVKYKVAGTKGVKDCDLKLTFSPPGIRAC